jgi:hypothetical protein
MNMPMMGVGPMNVLMNHSFMHMIMVVWLRVVFLVMQMPVMFLLIMLVLMPMRDGFMDMRMLMPLPVKAQYASEHQCSSEPEECGRVLAKQNQ